MWLALAGGILAVLWFLSKRRAAGEVSGGAPSLGDGSGAGAQSIDRVSGLIDAATGKVFLTDTGVGLIDWTSITFEDVVQLVENGDLQEDEVPEWYRREMEPWLIQREKSQWAAGLPDWLK